jgi:hypothetical protein
MVEGGCLCGAVRFRSAQAPIATRVCWCRDCQKLAAGSATVNAIFKVDDFEITGETTDYVSTADSGAVMHRRFCSTCGTPLFSASETRAHLIIARAGTLDDPTVVNPAATIWTASAPHWALFDETLPTAKGQPPPVA